MKTVIVVLNWNSYDMTRECIGSLLAMEKTGSGSFEILIVDNGSRDGSAERLHAALPQVEVIAAGRNLGFTGGCNLGIKRALEEGADYILLINNDTIVKADFLAELVAESERYPRAGMVSPKIYYYDDPQRIWWAGGTFSLWQGVPRHLGWKEVERGLYEVARPVDWATGCGVLLKSAALREAGLFDEKIFANGEDLDLSLRMRKSGWQIRYTPTAKMWHKEGFATRRNVGEHVRKFTATRNILWVMHKHATAMQWLTFWPYFAIRYIGVVVLKSLWRGDVKSAWSTLAGMAAYRRMRRHPDAQSLPKELMQSVRQPAEGAAIGRLGVDTEP
jgi:GT2 family glycosyltransferase